MSVMSTENLVVDRVGPVKNLVAIAVEGSPS